MAAVRFHFRHGKIQAVYQDGVLARLPGATISRASSIDPAPGGRCFEINWSPEVARVLGESWTIADEQGQPFRTRAQAEAYERRRLDRDYFGLELQPAT